MAIAAVDPDSNRANRVDLLEPLEASYQRFLQLNVDPEKRENIGLQAAARRYLNLTSGAAGRFELAFMSYTLERPRYDAMECRARGMFYAAPLKCVVRFLIWEDEDGAGKRALRDIKEQEVYMGEIPLMENGVFIVNGERRFFVPREADVWLAEDSVDVGVGVGDRKEEQEQPRTRLMLPGEWLAAAATQGLAEMSTEIQNRLAKSARYADTLMPHDLINARPLAAAMRTLLEKKTELYDVGNPLARVERLRSIGSKASLAPAKGRARAAAAKKLEATPIAIPEMGVPASWSVADTLIPFASSEDERAAGRAALRSALVPAEPTSPRITTGFETAIAKATGIVARAPFDGELEIPDDATLVLWPSDSDAPWSESGVVLLDRYQGMSEERDLMTTTRLTGDRVKRDEPIAHSDGARDAMLALGREAIVAFDAQSERARGLIVSEAFARAMATRHLVRVEAVLRDTPYGREELTRNVDGAGDLLDPDGIVRVGVTVERDDPLVGIATWNKIPKTTKERREMAARYPDGPDRVERAVSVPALPGDAPTTGTRGTVVDVEVFHRKGSEMNDRETAQRTERVARFERIRDAALARKETAPSFAEQLGFYADDRASLAQRGDELPPGVIRLIRVTIEVTRPLAIGDVLVDRRGWGAPVIRVGRDEDMPRRALSPRGSVMADVVVGGGDEWSAIPLATQREARLGIALHLLDERLQSSNISDADIAARCEEAGVETSGHLFVGSLYLLRPNDIDAKKKKKTKITAR